MSRDGVDPGEEIYGTRARIGLIYMASSWIMEPEFVRMAPPGVSIHTTRIQFHGATVEGLGRMAESAEVERCAELLATAPLGAICFGGTSASFLHGRGWDERLLERMAGASGGIPVTTTSTASLRALRAVGVGRIAFVGPYNDEVTERGRRFFEANGFEVVAALGLGLTTDPAIGGVSLATVCELARRGDRPRAEAIFISCTNLRTIGALAALEAELGKPVVSAIQASFWDCLRLAGVDLPVAGFGRLLAGPARLAGAVAGDAPRPACSAS